MSAQEEIELPPEMLAKIKWACAHGGGFCMKHRRIDCEPRPPFRLAPLAHRAD